MGHGSAYGEPQYDYLCCLVRGRCMGYVACNQSGVFANSVTTFCI